MSEGNLTVTFSNISKAGVMASLSPVTYEHCIGSFPLFVDPLEGNYRLQAGSPCISVGTLADAPEQDIKGSPRPLGSGIDMGAYEYFDDGSSMPVTEEGLGHLLTVWGNVKRSMLLQNYPNPLNPETWFAYRLALGSDVTFRIYDIRGHLVRELALGYQPAGSYLHRDRAAYWDGCDFTGQRVSSGVYYYQLQAVSVPGSNKDSSSSGSDFTAMRRMLVVK